MNSYIIRKVKFQADPSSQENSFFPFFLSICYQMQDSKASGANYSHFFCITKYRYPTPIKHNHWYHWKQVEEEDQVISVNLISSAMSQKHYKYYYILMNYWYKKERHRKIILDETLLFQTLFPELPFTILHHQRHWCNYLLHSFGKSNMFAFGKGLFDKEFFFLQFCT